MIIGSGLEYSLGLSGFYDYKPARQKIINEDIIVNCSSLSKDVLKIVGLLTKILRSDRFQSVIITSPYCLYRCICDQEKLLKEKVIPLLGCFKCSDCCIKEPEYRGLGEKINYKLLAKSIVEVTSAEALIITGLTPALSPVNMLPLIAKYGKPKLFLVDTFNNPYMFVVDYYVETPSYKLLEILGEINL